MYGAKGDEFLEYNLPTPNYLLHAQRGVFIGWLIKGYPGTKKSREFFNDIIARFILGFKNYRPERLPYKPNTEREAHKQLNVAYDLKNFQNLPSIKTRTRHYKASETNPIDQIFWAIKLHTEDLIRQYGESTPIAYSLLEEFAFRNFFDRKDKSTLKAKCRSVWNWYDERNWTIPTRREWEMTRSERAKANAELKKQRARATLLGFIKDSLLVNEYKKKDGTWNVTKLSKATGLDPKTVRKHLRELQEEGII